MIDREKVIEAIENCIGQPKCRDCPWEDCEVEHEVVNSVPYGLLRNVLAMLKEQGNCENCAIAIEDRQPIVRCKDCIYRGDKHKCILAFVADKQDFPYFFYDNRGEWFCADGKRK